MTTGSFAFSPSKGMPPILVLLKEGLQMLVLPAYFRTVHFLSIV
jgi:hypothetical protein